MARTRVGMMLRASAENREMARALGVDAKTALSRRDGCRHCLHGAGRRHRRAADVGLSRHGRPGADPVVCHHRAGRHRLAARRLVGSILLGLIDSFGKQFFPDYAAFLVYAAMIAVLTLRPQGSGAGQLAHEDAAGDARRRSAARSWRRRHCDSVSSVRIRDQARDHDHDPGRVLRWRSGWWSVQPD